MQYKRTPDARFDGLKDYPFSPHYVEVDDYEGGLLRMHYLDEGPADGEVVLCNHGQPSWSYLYRNMIPHLTKAGLRVIAPDCIGFGRSDKPTSIHDYSYARHVGWLTSLIDQLNLTDITLLGQDWGGLIGLRVATENEARFARIVAANTALPTGAMPSSGDIPESMDAELRQKLADTPALPPMEMMLKLRDSKDPFSFFYWIRFCAAYPDLDVGLIIQPGDGTLFPQDIADGYRAPFPDDSYMAGVRKFPSLVPILPKDPAIPANKKAWQVLARWHKPFICAFSDNDPVTAGADKGFLEKVPGCAGQKHTRIHGGGHFLQDARAAELAKVVVDFIGDNPLPTG